MWVHDRENWKLWIRANSVLVTFYIISFLGFIVNTSFEKDFQRIYFGATSIVLGLKLFVIPVVFLINFGRERPLQKAVGHAHRPCRSESHFLTDTLQSQPDYQTHVYFISPRNTTDFMIEAHIT
ncbi:hypothetical protein Ocin01_15940 [Orchesella cincta]|uniref:Uncharacterized protein n=1 Tax=Orchesella cincta TaxID=48709 RepID=A0A1D2MCY1_ORCCI|nr:hypothetical protein Ocin01_15940 [Orchesella cincta]